MLAAVFVGFAHINDGCLSGLNELCCFLWGDGRCSSGSHNGARLHFYRIYRRWFQWIGEFLSRFGGSGQVT